MKTIPVRGHDPLIDSTCFVADNARIIGNVNIGTNSSIWYNVVIRGDVMPIRIGKEVNVQDSSVLHGTYGKFGCTLEDRVTIGHSVILHGCYIGRESLVGMGSIIMDGAVIGEQCLIGAGTLITEGTQIPPRSLVLGRPGRVMRPLKDDELKSLSYSADNYLLYKGWYGDTDRRT